MCLAVDAASCHVVMGCSWGRYVLRGLLSLLLRLSRLSRYYPPADLRRFPARLELARRPPRLRLVPVAGCAGGWPGGIPSPTVANFEYLTEAIDAAGFIGRDQLDQDALDELLDERGADGWELVQVLPRQILKKDGFAAWVVIFKRPI